MNSISSRQLEYFVAVADRKSLSQAAAALGINQSAISRQILALERELKLKLFYRHGRGVALTNDGEHLLVRARRTIEEVRLISADAAAAQGGRPHSAVVALPLSVGPFLVAPVARHLTTAFPGIKLHFVEYLAPTLQERLSAGLIDLAVLYHDRTTRHLNAEPLVTDTLHLVASTKAPPLPATTPIGNLAELPLILPSKMQALRQLIDNSLATRHVKATVVLEVDSFSLAMRLVSANLGYAILPFTGVSDEVAGGVLQTSRIVEPEIKRRLVVATPASRPPMRGLSQIVKVMRAEFRTRMAPLR